MPASREAMLMRAECFTCHRPLVGCVCRLVTSVANTTPVTVLQHPRERFHAIGTARLLRLGLARCQVHVWPPDDPARLRPLALPPGAALLFPSPRARRLDVLPASERPSALVVIDATWPHAKAIYRATPWLHELPHVSLLPASPSAYRIRREPKADYLSTVEAVTQALITLEPDNHALGGLTAAFTAMIDRQIALRAAQPSRPYKRRRRAKASRSLPPALTGDHRRLVLVYGEFARRKGEHELVYFVAARPATGETFASLSRPSFVPDPRHLRNMGLELEQVMGAPAPKDLALRWRSFVAADDVLVAWNQGTLDGLGALATAAPPVLLKAAYCNHLRQKAGHLEELVPRHGLVPAALPFVGRAAVRLGAARALLDLLLGSEPAVEPHGEPRRQDQDHEPDHREGEHVLAAAARLGARAT